MIRARPFVLAVAALGLLPVGADAQRRGPQTAKVEEKTPKGNQALLLETFGDWGAYSTGQGATKICYAMSQPKARKTKGKGLDPAYLFVTTKPRSGVTNEVSFILGFGTKKDGDGTAKIGGVSFALLTKDNSAWIKNAAEQGRFLSTLKRESRARLEVTTYSGRDNEVVDSYSLNGAGDALDRAAKECK